MLCFLILTNHKALGFENCVVSIACSLRMSKYKTHYDTGWLRNNLNIYKVTYHGCQDAASCAHGSADAHPLCPYGSWESLCSVEVYDSVSAHDTKLAK